METQSLLDQLLQLPEYAIWMLFLAENILITISVLLIGHVLQQRFSPSPVAAYRYTSHEWFICAVTNLLNTLVTYSGFWLWKNAPGNGHVHLVIYPTGLSDPIPGDGPVDVYASLHHSQNVFIQGYAWLASPGG